MRVQYAALHQMREANEQLTEPRVPVALHWDPSPYAWRSYRVRVGNEERWFGLREDAEFWLRMVFRFLAKGGAL